MVKATPLVTALTAVEIGTHAVKQYVDEVVVHTPRPRTNSMGATMSSPAILRLDPPPDDRAISDPPQTIRRHGVVGLPELLTVIFSSLGQADLARAARVCQLWSPIALDFLWEGICNLDCLINAYSPKKKDDHIMHFKDVSKGGRWGAFWTYACRVRRLTWLEGEVYGPEVISHLLGQVANSTSGRTFLPNLRSLSFLTSSWKGPSLFLFSLIPSTLEDLYIKNSSSNTLRLIRELMTVSAKHLKVVELRGPQPILKDHRLAYTTFLSHQKNLQSLQIAGFTLAPEEIRAIGELHNLIELELCHS